MPTVAARALAVLLTVLTIAVLRTVFAALGLDYLRQDVAQGYGAVDLFVAGAAGFLVLALSVTAVRAWRSEPLGRSGVLTVILAAAFLRWKWPSGPYVNILTIESEPVGYREPSVMADAVKAGLAFMLGAALALVASRAERRETKDHG